MKKGATKVEVEEPEQIDQFFDYFESHGDKVVPAEVKYSMRSIGFDTRTPNVYNIVNEIEGRPELKNGISREQFIKVTNEIRSGRDDDDELKRVFELFLGDEEVITLDSFQKIAEALGVELKEPELMWKICTQGKGTMDFGAFCELMRKNFAE